MKRIMQNKFFWLFLVVLFALPVLPHPIHVPEYWVTLLNYIGLYSIVAIGLVLLTGIGGMTSFGQAAFVGIGTTQAGRLAFTLAAGLGALCGILVAPLTTIYYDSGFLIGLKGFVGAIIGGLVSYPLAAAGSILVGLLESYSSFWASAYKEVIVFTLIIPVLLWRSLASPHSEEEEE